MDLSEIDTSDLIKELRKRENVLVHKIEGEVDKSITFQGPSIILEIFE